MNSELDLAVLQLLKLKGIATAETLVATLGEAVDSSLPTLLANGHIKEAKNRYRVTPDGKQHLAALLEQERATVDHASLAAIYDDFHELNAEFKSLATEWQLRNGQPNDHSDAAYDQSILEQVADLHPRFMPLVARAAAAAPRLSHYPARFLHALDNIQAGDHGYFLKPIIDSYHTIWFELHEDLIGLTNRSRLEEAAAGRAD